MIFMIRSNTPVWVWGPLAALMALGFSHTYGASIGPLLGRALALLKLTRTAAAVPSLSSLQWSAGRGKPLAL